MKGDCCLILTLQHEILREISHLLLITQVNNEKNGKTCCVTYIYKSGGNSGWQ